MENVKIKNNLLNNPWSKEEVSRKIRKYSEPMKENGIRSHPNLWNPDKEVLEINLYCGILLNI